jgi:hypothetical protein
MAVRVRVCDHNSVLSSDLLYYTEFKDVVIQCHIARMRLKFYKHGGKRSLAKHEVLSVVLSSDMLRCASGQMSQAVQVNVVPKKRRNCLTKDTAQHPTKLESSRKP